MLTREKVESLLQAAKNADRKLQVFGAGSHKYQLNPVTTIEKVQEFEGKYGLKLPEAYVRFLTEIGNGGAESLKERKRYVSSLNRFDTLSKKAIDFLLDIREKELDSIRLDRLLKASLVHGIPLFEAFLYRDNETAAVECARMLPKEKKNYYYQKMIELLYQKNHVDKKQLLFYVTDCSCKQAGHVVEYAKNMEYPEDVRRNLKQTLR